MEEIEYSVVIRTTGKAGQKYQALLNSIDSLNPPPREVIVVLPEGYDLPPEHLGYETFYFSPKGMVIQRLTGMERCKTRYALVCDDDVTFSPDFVQKLYPPLKEGAASFSAGPLYSFLPPKGPNAMLCTLMGSAMPTVLHRRSRYVTVLKSTGYSYNRNLVTNRTAYYETQAVAWTCFFADVHAFRKLEFEKEVWLDAHGYSALDDQTMFYKAWLMNHKTVVVSDAFYTHLDAKTSTRNNKPAALYSSTFNRVVFWHRFIYSMQHGTVSRALSRSAFAYRMAWLWIWEYISVLRHRLSTEDYQLLKKGYRDGWEYIRSQEYHSLPDIRLK